MSIIDLLIVLIFLIGFVLGFKDGLIRKLVGFVGFVLAIIVSSLFYNTIGNIIESVTGMEIYLANIVSGALIFILIMFVFSVLKRVIHPFDKVNNLLNQLLGGVMGALQILFFLSAVFYLLNVFSIPGKETKNSSIFYSKIYKLLPSTIDFLNNYTPGTKEILKDYINETDSVK